MSSILKALKKLEQEKNTRKPESLKIDAEILRNKPIRQKSHTGLVFAALFLFICGSGATYVIMSRQAVTVTVPQVIQETPRADSSKKVAVPPATAPDEPMVQIDRINPPLQKNDPVKSKPLLTESGQAMGENMFQRIPHSEEKRADIIPGLKQEPAKIQRKIPVAPASILTVNGIAFQEGDADNIAVVNGVSVSRGSVVDGATVIEIMKDRVKFTIGAETFEVGLGKSNQ